MTLHIITVFVIYIIFHSIIRLEIKLKTILNVNNMKRIFHMALFSFLQPANYIQACTMRTFKKMSVCLVGGTNSQMHLSSGCTLFHLQKALQPIEIQVRPSFQTLTLDFQTLSSSSQIFILLGSLRSNYLITSCGTYCINNEYRVIKN